MKIKVKIIYFHCILHGINVFLKSGRYILKVHAYNRGGDVATVKSGFVINDN